MKTKKEPTALAPEELDTFVMAVITALRKIDDPYATAEVKDLLITPALNELLLFVGITSKQTEGYALFAWTESVHVKPAGEKKNAS